MSTTNKQMNDWLRGQRASGSSARLTRALAAQHDPEAILDSLALEAASDPDILTRLDSTTRRLLGDYLLSGETISRELAARRERLQQQAAAEQDEQAS